MSSDVDVLDPSIVKRISFQRYLSPEHAYGDAMRGVKPAVEYLDRWTAERDVIDRLTPTPATLKRARLIAGRDMTHEEVGRAMRGHLELALSMYIRDVFEKQAKKKGRDS